MNVLIRVDASKNIGFGHLKRCHSLAQEMVNRGLSVTFLVAPESLTFLPELQQEFPTILIEANLTEIQDAEACVAILKKNFKNKKTSVVIDSYRHSISWETSVKRHATHLIVIDDVGREHCCDLLIDQGYFEGSQHSYSSSSSNAILLLGPRFALLSNSYRELHKSVSRQVDEIKNILICFGGADPHNLSVRVLQHLSETIPCGISIHIVLGPTHPDQKVIQALCSQNDGFICHTGLTDLATLMSQCDVAIGAGGTMNWERCCMGLPTIVIATADNQKELCNQLSKQHVIEYLGSVGDVPLKEAAQRLTQIIANPERISEIRTRSLELVDGRGAKRVTAWIRGLEIDIRAATSKDCENIREWRNHPNTRQHVLDSRVIEKTEHNEWFAKTLADSDRNLLVGYIENKPVGVVRFDHSHNSVRVSIFLVPDLQQKGLGLPLLVKAEHWLQRTYPNIQILTAEILHANQPSIHIFRDAGFTEKEGLKRGDGSYWEKLLDG